MSNSTIASWVGASAYTPPAGDAVTASWVGAGPEMPTAPLTISLSLATAAYPGFESIATDPLVLGFSQIAATYDAVWELDIPNPLTLSFSLLPGSVPAFYYGVDDTLLFRLVLGEEIPAYRLSPEQVLPGYSSDGTNITIPIASVIGLTSAEADAITGDWREILQAIFLRAVEYHKTWVWSDQTRTYEPSRKDLYYSGRINSHFQIKFLTDMGEPNVAPEP